MINFLSKWIEGIALAVIITSIFEMIIPNGNLKKYIKIVLGIYVIFSMIAPFVDSKELYNIDVSETIDNYSGNLTQNTLSSQNKPKNNLDEIYKTTFEKEIKQAVEKQGYNIYKCNVAGTFDAEKTDAGINKIDIIIESKKEENNALKQSTNTENKIIIEDIKTVEKVEINIDEKNKIYESGKSIAIEDINKLKKYLSDHFEIDKKIINITTR